MMVRQVSLGTSPSMQILRGLLVCENYDMYTDEFVLHKKPCVICVYASKKKKTSDVKE